MKTGLAGWGQPFNSRSTRQGRPEQVSRRIVIRRCGVIHPAVIDIDVIDPEYVEFARRHQSDVLAIS